MDDQRQAAGNIRVPVLRSDDERCLPLAVRADSQIAEVASMIASRVKMAMLLVRPVPVAAGALEVGLFALGDLVDVHAVAPWRKAGHVQSHKNSAFPVQPCSDGSDLFVRAVDDGPAERVRRGCENLGSRCRAVRADRWLSIATLLAAPRDDQRPA